MKSHYNAIYLTNELTFQLLDIVVACNIKSLLDNTTLSLTSDVLPRSTVDTSLYSTLVPSVAAVIVPALILVPFLTT